MKRCPSCHRVYTDDAMSFCLQDGTPLEAGAEVSSDQPETVKIPPARVTNQAATEVLPVGSPGPTQASPASGQSQYDASAQAAPAERKTNALPWILGAALILGLSAIVVALIVTRGIGTGGSETAKNSAQVEGATPSENGSTGPDGASPTTEGDINTVGSTREETSSTPQPGRTPDPSSATPKPTSTPRPTPSPAKTATPKPEIAEQRSPISGGVLNGRAISKPLPPYPAIARAARAQGTVTVQVTIDENGRVMSASAVSGHPLLRESAVKAAYGARFTPTLLSGRPVKVSGVLTYNFVLQ